MSSKHLTEIEAGEILGLEASGSSQQSTAAMSMMAHLQECSACASLMEEWRAADRTIKAVRYLPNASNGDPCPAEDIWLELVAGIVEEKPAMRLLEHCSRCESCAQQLRRAGEGLEEDNAEAPVSESASPEWQLRMAQRMAAQVSASRPQKPHHGKLFWGMWAAGVAAVFLIALWLFPFRKTPQASDIDQMLANAYSQGRTLVLRMPGAPHAGLQQLRSGGQGSLFNSGSLEASKDAITAFCKRKQESTDCLLFQAQLNLLDWRYQPALKTLARVKPDPGNRGESERYFLAHATALFEQAEQSGEDQDLYGQAVKDLSAILTDNPNDVIALFNRAIIYEKLGWLDKASADWQRFLEIEKDSGWRDEAKQHSDSIQQKKNPAR